MNTQWTIYGKYGNEPWEEIDNAETKNECEYLLREYKLAFGNGWKFKIKLEKVKD